MYRGWSVPQHSNCLCEPYRREITENTYSRVTLYTAGHLHTAVPHCSHSRAPIVHTAVPRENNGHGCVYLRCRAVCKLPGCVEGHPWYWKKWTYQGFIVKESYVAILKYDIWFQVNLSKRIVLSWWRHQMETFSASLAFREENPLITGGFPLKRPVTRSFVVSFTLHLNKQLSKQSRCRWFETPSHSLWCHRNVVLISW